MTTIRALQINSKPVLAELTFLLSSACTPPDSVWIPGFSGLMAVAEKMGARASVIECMTFSEEKLHGPGA